MNMCLEKGVVYRYSEVCRSVNTALPHHQALKQSNLNSSNRTFESWGLVKSMINGYLLPR